MLKKWYKDARILGKELNYEIKYRLYGFDNIVKSKMITPKSFSEKKIFNNPNRRYKKMGRPTWRKIYTWLC